MIDLTKIKNENLIDQIDILRKDRIKIAPTNNILLSKSQVNYLASLKLTVFASETPLPNDCIGEFLGFSFFEEQ